MGMGFLSTLTGPDQSDDDDDDAGRMGDPLARFTAAAAELGLIRPGDKLDRNLVDLCLCVVEMAARIGDAHRVPGYLGETVGRLIRDELGEQAPNV